MRILCLANNWVGLQVVGWLARAESAESGGDEIVGLVVHPPERQRYGAEITAAANLPADRVLLADQLHDPQTLERIRDLEADIAVSLFFGYVIKNDFLRIFLQGCVNLHPALLPYNRGANPNVWTIVDGTPAGVTLHYVDEGIDSGDIIAWRKVPVSPTDTGASLYRRLEEACVTLFRDVWRAVSAGEAPRIAQNEQLATFHRTRDLEKIDAIDPEATFTARELIDIIRARTFPPYAGAYIQSEGQRIYLRLEMLTEEELAAGGQPE